MVLHISSFKWKEEHCPTTQLKSGDKLKLKNRHRERTATKGKQSKMAGWCLAKLNPDTF